jgi:carboxyl-terminal processing protease
LVREGIDGMLQTLDPYTDYIPEDEIEAFRITTTGQYAGIGALIGIVNDKAVITHPYKGFPAHKAGLMVGDELVAVDGNNVIGKSTAEISTFLKGQARTDVEVKIKRYGAGELKFKIRREKISISNLAYYGLVSPEVGYIRLDDFTPGAGKEVSDAVMELKSTGAKKIILDLRGNPGGLLHEAINVANLFIPKGKEVVSTKGKVEEWNKVYTTLNNPIDTEIPLAILTSEGSASASEIVAGSLQDYDRAVIVGRKTFGKGLVQTTRPLAYNTQLKVTTAKYYIPSGRCIQAIDYTNRNEDGSVDKFPDSLRREFKTSLGRMVYDGNGLDPDIAVENEYLGTVAVALINSGLLFDYASRYRSEHQGTKDFSTFKLSDVEYDKFVNWLRSQKFSYSSPLETTAKQLAELARKERYHKDIESQLNGLKSKIESNKAGDLTRFKDEISELLEQQIAFHYALNEGQAALSLPKDREVSKAIQILNDSAQLKKILSPK